jgi:hypothetical protein
MFAAAARTNSSNAAAAAAICFGPLDCKYGMWMDKKKELVLCSKS